MLDILLPSIIGLIGFFHLFYFIAVLKRDFSIVDIAWGLGFVVVLIASFWTKSDALNFRDYILSFCISVWAFRLAIYIYLRNQNSGEDFRYQEMRKNWKGSENLQAYFKVFWLQCVLLFIVSLPIPIIIHKSTHSQLSIWDYLGLGLWLIGFLFEAVSDYQKNDFKKDPENKNRPFDKGLWRYSRHPNYFGEFLLWWGVFFLSLGTELTYIAVIGPIFISFLLLKVSGVPLLEEKYKRFPAYKEYADKTNSFFPWPPKK